MIFRCVNERLVNYGKTYSGEVVKNYLNGYMVDIGGDLMLVAKSDIEIIEMSDKDRRVNITW